MNRLRKYLKKLSKPSASNLKVVSLCVLAATTFWTLNALNKDDYTTIVEQPIEFYYDREQYMAVGDLPTDLRIEINGNGWDLLRKYFNLNVIPFPIRLDDPSAQDYILTSSLQRALAEQTAPTQLAAILEDTIKLSIDKIVEGELKPVLDTATNPLAENFRFASSITIEPNEITVKGPGSIMEKMEGQIFFGLSQGNINSNYADSISLTIPEEYRSFLVLEDKSVFVEFDVVEFLEGEKKLSIRTFNFPSTVELASTDTIVVMEYLVDEREVEALQGLKLEALLNYNNRNPEDSTVDVRLNIMPEYIDSVSFFPETFKLRYE